MKRSYAPFDFSATQFSDVCSSSGWSIKHIKLLCGDVDKRPCASERDMIDFFLLVVKFQRLVKRIFG